MFSNTIMQNLIKTFFKIHEQYAACTHTPQNRKTSKRKEMYTCVIRNKNKSTKKFVNKTKMFQAYDIKTPNS